MECGRVISEVNCVAYNAFNQADECELMMAQFLGSDLSFDAQSFWADQAMNANYFEHLFGNPNPTDSNDSNNGSSVTVTPPISEYDIQSYLNNPNDALGVNISSYSSSLDLSLVQEQNANAYLNLTPIANEVASTDVNSDPGTNPLKPTTRQKRKFDEFDIPGGSPPEKKTPVKRSTRKGKAKEQQITEEEESNETTAEEMSSVACNSDDDSNGSGNSGPRPKRSSSANATNGGKTRAGRGSATDPQSLYARKRRERINERLKTLQNLVPNGTKVDISTMLEEAVQYVKLLQLQIKMLSSDELWMYAPIAYNGMNIGIDLNI